MEQGLPLSLADLTPDTITALAKVRAAAGSRNRDWARYTRQAARSTPASSSGRTHSPRPELIARYRCSVEILLATALASACTSASIHDWYSYPGAGIVSASRAGRRGWPRWPEMSGPALTRKTARTSRRLASLTRSALTGRAFGASFGFASAGLLFDLLSLDLMFLAFGTSPAGVIRSRWPCSAARCPPAGEHYEGKAPQSDRRFALDAAANEHFRLLRSPPTEFSWQLRYPGSTWRQRASHSA